MERAVRGFILTLIIFFKSANSYYGEEEFDTAQIILFYSTLNDSPLIRGQIAIYWYVEDFDEGDALILYYNDSELDALIPTFTYYPTDLSGSINTGVRPTKVNYSSEMIYVEQCLGYYGAWLRNNSIKKMSCLSTHPDWMSKHKLQLMNMKLGDLFIPGTHNSGSYSEKLPPTIIQRYTVTQDKSVFDQLISGVRYLDIRPCVYNMEYWICHGTFQMQPFDKIIQEIKKFMDHTNEIVIVSFKEFPRGFYFIQDHVKFLSHITSELADHFDSFFSTDRVTLGDLWKIGKRLILSYYFISSVETYHIFTKIPQQWGDVRNLSQLDDFLNKAENVSVDHCPLVEVDSCLRAVMAEVTLDSSMIIADAAAYYFGGGSKSLRQLGVEAGPLITAWYNEIYFEKANIVAVDFIDTTGIVEVSIQCNLARSKKLNGF